MGASARRLARGCGKFGIVDPAIRRTRRKGASSIKLLEPRALHTEDVNVFHSFEAGPFYAELTSALDSKPVVAVDVL